MISRYDSAKTKKSDKGKQVYQTLTLPNIPELESDTYIITNSTDRLDSLAFKYYGEAKYWWIIAVANNIGRGTMSLQPGIQLRIPANPSTIISELDNANQ